MVIYRWFNGGLMVIYWWFNGGLMGFTIWLFNSSPWKDPPFLSSVNYLFLWAMASMAMLNNQRVCFFFWGDHMEEWYMIHFWG
jgi:hypothetical protein